MKADKPKETVSSNENNAGRATSKSEDIELNDLGNGKGKAK
jgi:hypothetical protein